MQIKNVIDSPKLTDTEADKTYESIVHSHDRFGNLVHKTPVDSNLLEVKICLKPGYQNISRVTPLPCLTDY